MIASAIQSIRDGAASCVVIRNGEIVKSVVGNGIAPVLALYKQGLLKDSLVVDKIVGKAAAMIMLLGGAKEVYGEIMSVPGQEYLEKHGVAASFGRRIDMIANRESTGICPMERTVMGIEDPQKGLEALEKTLAFLQSQAKKANV